MERPRPAGTDDLMERPRPGHRSSLWSARVPRAPKHASCVRSMIECTKAREMRAVHGLSVFEVDH